MTNGIDCLWLNLDIFVLTMIVGSGGLLHAIAGDEYGWQIVGISIGVYLANCASLLIYFLH